MMDNNETDLPILKPIKKKNRKTKAKKPIDEITAKPHLKQDFKYEDKHKYEERSGLSNLLGFRSDREAKTALESYFDLFMNK
jgi:hypothetical protein